MSLVKSSRQFARIWIAAFAMFLGALSNMEGDVSSDAWRCPDRGDDSGILSRRVVLRPWGMPVENRQVCSVAGVWLPCSIVTSDYGRR